MCSVTTPKLRTFAKNTKLLEAQAKSFYTSIDPEIALDFEFRRP